MAAPVEISFDSPAPSRPAARLTAGRLVSLILLLLAPSVAWQVGAAMDRASGPRWLGAAYDPDYPYLLNAVNIAEGHAPRHTDHPGTPVQVTASGLLIIRHWVSPGAPTLRDEVLADPEGALAYLSLAVRAIHAASLAAFGLAAWRYTRSVLVAVVAQSVTLMSMATLQSLCRISPEPLVAGITLLLAGTVLMALARAGATRPRFAAVSGALVAAGVATKVTFAPAALVVWPMLVSREGRSRRLPAVHLAAGAAALTLLLIPILPQIGRVLLWLKSIALSSGMYGIATDHTIVDTGRYPADLWRLVAAEPAAAGIGIAAALMVIVACVPPISRRLDDRGRLCRATLGAVAAVQIIQFVLVAKHPLPRYLLPAAALSGLAVSLMYALAAAILPPVPRRVVYAVAAGALLIAGRNVYRQTHKHLAWATAQIAPRLELSQETERRVAGGAVIAYAYGSSSPVYALLFADHWAGCRFAADLERMFPSRLMSVRKTGDYTFVGDRPVPETDLERWAAEGRLLFQGRPVSVPVGFDETPIFRPGRPGTEALYQASPPE